MAYAGDRRALAATAVRRIVRQILAEERHALIACSVTFLSPAKMRVLNRRSLGKDRATDVIAFELPHGETLVGDVYICPAVARRSARTHGIPVRQELVRLLVHGVLHVLGYDHPAGAGRSESEMWRRQEHYVRTILETAE